MIQIYTDGGVFQDRNEIKWAFVAVENDDVVWKQAGTMACGGKHNEDVERAESEALYQACQRISQHVNNYVIYSDSRSFIDKIQKRCSNATKNPHVKYIQELLSQIKGTPLPYSLTIKWKPRRSDRWSKYVDDLCS
jgi:ribonuclease HI